MFKCTTTYKVYIKAHLILVLGCFGTNFGLNLAFNSIKFGNLNLVTDGHIKGLIFLFASYSSSSPNFVN